MNDYSLVLGVLIGIAVTLLILLFIRDFLIQHFLNKSVSQAFITKIDKNGNPIMDKDYSVICEEVLDKKIGVYRDLLINSREAITTIRDSVPEDKHTVDQCNTILSRIDNEFKELRELDELTKD